VSAKPLLGNVDDHGRLETFGIVRDAGEESPRHKLEHPLLHSIQIPVHVRLGGMDGRVRLVVLLPLARKSKLSALEQIRRVPAPPPVLGLNPHKRLQVDGGFEGIRLRTRIADVSGIVKLFGDLRKCKSKKKKKKGRKKIQNSVGQSPSSVVSHYSETYLHQLMRRYFHDSRSNFLHLYRVERERSPEKKKDKKKKKSVSTKGLHHKH
jgi:hypothetical protein